ncbi:unnamed protein product [Peronospora destructor]|uniref:Uncharacterized protein n=1 Tax=Peronospora destructor TaxID=86335 RepID=A0AAV0THV6_9STRA|nr:unnamed protein product [Peronospora destructor]
MFQTMLGSTKFQRVKSLWHTRMGHSKSIKSADSHETPVQEVTTAAEVNQGYCDSVIDDKVEMHTLRTPTLTQTFIDTQRSRIFKPPSFTPCRCPLFHRR